MLDTLKQIDALKDEAEAVYLSLVLPHWGKELHGFPQTLYGYMMGVFSLIDLLSAYWRGSTSSEGQTKRMTDFMNEYISPCQEANRVAIQIWRHKLMHTAQPRILPEKKSGKKYRWLLHWREHLPRDQHYTFAETHDSKILNIGLMYLIEDLKKGASKYKGAMHLSAELQKNYCTVENQLTDQWLESGFSG